ncbi:hypothetical protein OE09_0995 [Flavobacteriaceae bacterium MAR_2010_72]|nr:hypothetical protein OE09_0995 [Flavobacteriaceae bacterium MAR_2010_72]TVZ60202.1 hypothetical protein NA63_2753 [Flavobacteriaceae bacterium MAR_2010_105]
MIKFFRRIRQGLLSDNKYSKYLLYAVGEIILVMIGILLALQVNNQNELRKTRIEEKLALGQLKQDLLSEIALLNSESTNLKREEFYLNSISKGAYNKVPLDSLFFNLSRNLDFEATTVDTKYFGLKSNSKLDIITNNSLKEELVEFYESVHSDFKSYIDYHKVFVITNIESYLVEKFPMNRFLKITDTKFVIEELKNSNIMTQVHYQIFYIKRFLKKIKTIIKLANNLVEKIDVEIESYQYN